MDDDLCRVGDVEVGRLLLCFGERLLVEHLGTVHVPPCEQQVLHLELDFLLPVLQPGGVVEVRALFIALNFLHT